MKTMASVFAQVAFEAQKLDSAMRIIFERALADHCVRLLLMWSLHCSVCMHGVLRMRPR